MYMHIKHINYKFRQFTMVSPFKKRKMTNAFSIIVPWFLRKSQFPRGPLKSCLMSCVGDSTMAEKYTRTIFDGVRITYRSKCQKAKENLSMYEHITNRVRESIRCNRRKEIISVAVKLTRLPLQFSFSLSLGSLPCDVTVKKYTSKNWSGATIRTLSMIM